MPIRFRLLTEDDVRSVLAMDDLIDAMASALRRFSAGRVVQPLRSIIELGDSGRGDTFLGTMPALAREPDALGAKLVTVVADNRARGLPSHMATIVLLDPQTGALAALLDGRYITEARTAAVSAVSSRLLARPEAASLAILGSGVQARSHLDALGRVHRLRRVTVWSPTRAHRERFAREARDRGTAAEIRAVDHPAEAASGADLIVVATASASPVLEDRWVKPGAHVMAIGACRPAQREIDPALMARAVLVVDSREAALVESGDVVLGIAEGRFGADHIAAELGDVVAGATVRRSDRDVTLFKSLGLAVEDVVAAELAWRRAVERGVGRELEI